MKNLIALILVLFILPASAANTKYYGGYISAHIETSGWTFTYQINVYLYTQKDSLPPDTIQVETGDGIIVKAGKTDSTVYPNNTILSTYSFVHSYAGPGIYIIDYVDTLNQNFERNINPNAGFYIQSDLNMSWFGSTKTQSTFYDIPIVKAQKNHPFDYNPVALFDTTGDSLNFKLAPANANTGYWLPPGISINKYSGEAKWPNPDTLGDYTLMISIEQYKQGVLIGKQLKRVTISVDSLDIAPTLSNVQNWQTNSNGYYEYHIHPSDNLQLFFSYRDTLADTVSIAGYSEVFQSPNSGNFSTINYTHQAYGLFDWTPDSANVRNYPYLVNFICRSDKDTASYFKYITVMIYVDAATNGMNELTINQNNLKVYPNPAANQLHISYSGNPTNAKSLTVEVHSLTGQLLMKKTIDTKAQLDISKLPNGIYFMLLKNKQGVAVARKKFVVMR